MSRAILLSFAIVAAMIVVGAVLTNDGGSTTAERQLASAIAADLVDVEVGLPPTPFESSSASCVGDEVVQRVGIDRLTEIGLTAGAVARIGFRPHELSLSTDERTAIVEAMDACVDLLDTAVQSLAPARGEATRACVRAALGDDGARLLWTWRVGPFDEAQPEGLAPKLAIVDDCLNT